MYMMKGPKDATTSRSCRIRRPALDVGAFAGPYREPVPDDPLDPPGRLMPLDPELVPDVPELPEEPLELAPAPASSRFWQPAMPANATLTASKAIMPFAFFISVSSCQKQGSRAEIRLL
ncbi:hypothetical protein [Lacisediminimonas sp.]|uniref:hypothetical protein n=1 Tax=Lacisediminimonas sp. TaxID=3060582 RepID=UPI00272B0E4A|nr:hypothetical protein [Lacisediminimonas sp.]